MYSDDLAIKISDLSKCYNIYNKPIDRLKQSFVPRAQMVLGKPIRNYYHEFWALRNLSMEVHKGETIGVIGRNGSGKSALLQLICGTLTPTGGKVETVGRTTALLELGSGFNPEFTGRENVFLNGAILGLRQDEIEHHFDAIAGFADIGEFIDQPVKFYSSGMTVRLAFAVQAMVDPDILIVDEALAVGDERFQRKCFRRLEELKKNGTSILFVSHAGQQLVELCDRALFLEQGQRLLLTDPLTVVRAYHRMIYAAPAEQALLRKEFQELDKDGGASVLPPASSLPDEYVSMQPEAAGNISETDFFEHGMIPDSTEVYPIQGARIDSIKIYNSKGREVNNLLMGREYQFEIRGMFLEDRASVSVGFHIRTLTSVGLTGQLYPGPGKYIHDVKAGQRFRLVHRIKMNLTPNTYFAGGGISSNTEPIMMHRILDAIMFRVLPTGENRAWGYVNLAASEPEFEIIEL